MKKAYVKPVFFAEVFEGTSTVAACDYSANSNTLPVWEGKNLCINGNCAHAVGKKDYAGVNWWEYATGGMKDDGDETTPIPNFVKPTSDNFSAYNDSAYLFTDGDMVCDFVWNDVGTQVGIWTSVEGDTSKAVSNVGTRVELAKQSNLFVTFISSFTDFFGIEPKNSDQHLPGIYKQQFFS